MKTVDWMTKAMTLSRAAARAGEFPVGAIITRRGARRGDFLVTEREVSRASNSLRSDCNPLAHAEIKALSRFFVGGGASKMKYYGLKGCLVYTTLEPCLLCLGAAMMCRIGGIIYQSEDPKGGVISTNTNNTSVFVERWRPTGIDTVGFRALRLVLPVLADGGLTFGVAGGVGVNAWGSERRTWDIDIEYDSTLRELKEVAEAAGLVFHGAKNKDRYTHVTRFTFQNLLNVDFLRERQLKVRDKIFGSLQTRSLSGLSFPVLARESLITLKDRVRRPQDQGDIQFLMRQLGRA